MRGAFRWNLLWFILLGTACPPRVLAQREVPFARLALLGGQLHYRLPESRNDALLALRLAAPLMPLGQRRWLVEAGVSYGWYKGGLGQRRHVFITELQLQAHSGARLLQPYLGIGGGLGLTQVDSSLQTRATLSASAGMRADLTESLGVLGELRLRQLGFFRDWTRELTMGVYASWR
jgi:hypothetical protein